MGELRGLEMEEREGSLLEDRLERVRRERLFVWADRWWWWLARFVGLFMWRFLLSRALEIIK